MHSESTPIPANALENAYLKKNWDAANYIYWSIISIVLGLYILEFFILKDLWQQTFLFKTGILALGILGFALLKKKSKTPHLLVILLSALFSAYCLLIIQQVDGVLVTLYFVILTLVIGGLNYLALWRGVFGLILVLTICLIYALLLWYFGLEKFYPQLQLGGYAFLAILLLTSFIPDARKRNYKMNLEKELKREDLLKTQANQIRNLNLKYGELTEANKIEKQKEKILRHDLKNKINNIIGLSQLLQLSTDKLDEEEKNYIQLLQDVSIDLLRYADNLFAKEDQDTSLKINLQPVNCYASLRKTKKGIKAKLDEYGLDLKLNKEEAQYFLLTDLLIFNNVVENILNYLIIWSKPDESIQVTCLPVDENIRIEFLAPSARIPASELNRIFKPIDSFEFTSSFAAPQGLGLQIAKSMTEQMGGYFKYQTELEGGVIFKLEFKQVQNPQILN
ncbi:sensor histidine kinase [Algoriphagus litoralis]|uniref:sensor histidine kinase n=1 Tax=Algoriphagus litoralis TaxID=2202829 RepID=UPI000DB99D6C|nr:HAMP domain-containing sensor histidine kinase [Algoriphagus litoralis]